MKSENKPGYQTAEVSSYDCLKEKQSDLKKNFTETERIIWNVIRNRQLGYKFRRQHVIDNYIVDFICLERNLIIEIDGGYHLNSEQMKRDENRTKALNALGYKVIRFSNEEVISALNAVIDTIKKEL